MTTGTEDGEVRELHADIVASIFVSVIPVKEEELENEDEDEDELSC